MNLLTKVLGAVVACAIAGATGCSGSSDVVVGGGPAAGDDDGGATGAQTGAGGAGGGGGGTSAGGGSTGGGSGGGGSGGGGSGGPGSGGGSSDAGASSDATTGAGCNALVDDATPATVQELAASAPQPTGGAIPNGTYHLKDITVFSGPNGTTTPIPLSIRSTVSVHGDTVDLVQDTANKTERMTETFVTSGASVTFTDACPATHPSLSGGYSAGAGFTLFATNGAGQIVTYTYQ